MFISGQFALCDDGSDKDYEITVDDSLRSGRLINGDQK